MYADIANGNHAKRLAHPLESFFRQRGARIRTNTFCDPSLKTGDEIVVNLLRIIRSGRGQGFEKLVLHVPKADLQCTDKIARQLMVMERVVIEVSEESENAVLSVYFPDHIWMESAFWNAQSRTQWHPHQLSKCQLDQIKGMFAYRPISNDEMALLANAVDLDESVPDSL